MTRKELIQLIQYTCGEIVISCTITEEDAESILDDFTNETSLEEYLPPLYPEMMAPYDTTTNKNPSVIDAVRALEAEEQTPQDRPERYASRELNGMDVIDLVEHWNLSFTEGNILKYLLRDKGEDIQDL